MKFNPKKKIQSNFPSSSFAVHLNIQEWLLSNFSLQYQPWIKCEGYDNKSPGYQTNSPHQYHSKYKEKSVEILGKPMLRCKGLLFSIFSLPLALHNLLGSHETVAFLKNQCLEIIFNLNTYVRLKEIIQLFQLVDWSVSMKMFWLNYSSLWASVLES